MARSSGTKTSKNGSIAPGYSDQASVADAPAEPHCLSGVLALPESCGCAQSGSDVHVAAVATLDATGSKWPPDASRTRQVVAAIRRTRSRRAELKPAPTTDWRAGQAARPGLTHNVRSIQPPRLRP